MYLRIVLSFHGSTDTRCSNENVPFAATLAGHLKYRGEINDNIANSVPLVEWTHDQLLALFTMNCNADFNFDKYFRETHVRLFVAVFQRLNWTASKLQRLYVLACLEQEGFARVIDRGRPLAHREAFVRGFRRYKREDFNFKVLAKKDNDRLARDIKRNQWYFAKQWWESRAADRISQSYWDGVDILQCLFLKVTDAEFREKMETEIEKVKIEKVETEIEKKDGKTEKDRGPSRRQKKYMNRKAQAAKEKTSAMAPKPLPIETDIYHVDVANLIRLNLSELPNYANGNPILEGLVAPINGLHVYEAGDDVADINLEDPEDKMQEDKIGSLSDLFRRQTLDPKEKPVMSLDAMFDLLAIESMVEGLDVIMKG